MTNLTTSKLREKMLRVIEMRGCGWIPCRVAIQPATWHKYREKLECLVLRHPMIFPGFRQGSVNFDDFGHRRKGNTYVDAWGCVWYFNFDGLQGQVIKHPLEDWSALKEYNPPDPEAGICHEGGPLVSWDVIEKSIKEMKKRGELVIGSMPHGFFFQRLYYLRGFVNLMSDLVKEPPEIFELIEIVTNYNMVLVNKLLRLGVDIINFGDDLGMQDRMPISHRTFRKFIFPTYAKIFGRVREAGVHVYLHSDGHVIEIIDDLIEAGVTVLNIQDKVNGIDNIKTKCKGKVCVDLDIDRQHLLPFGTPKEIKSHIKNVVVKLGSRKGGLMLLAGIYPDVPLKNIEALCQAMEEYMHYYGCK